MLLDNEYYLNKSNKESWYYIDFELYKTKYTREELLKSLFNDFIQKWKCKVEDILEAMDILYIKDNKMFDFALSKTDFLVDENVYYTIRNEQNNKKVTTYYNIYVNRYCYASIALNKIAEYIVRKYYPELFKGIFKTEKRRFKESIHNLPTNINTKISDIDSLVLFENELTIKDILDIYTAKDKNAIMNEIVSSTRLKIYECGNIFIKVDDKHDYSLYVTIEDLHYKNWNNVKKRHVQGILLYDNNGEQIRNKWFEGHQENAPYFNMPIINKIKQFFE